MNVTRIGTTALLTGMLALGSAGCASKKFVRGKVAPLDDRVTGVEGKTAANSGRIDGLDEKLDKDVSRVDELARSAEAQAKDAGEAAEAANSRAAGAESEAKLAKALGDRNHQSLTSLNERMAMLEKYQLKRTVAVQFGFGKAALDAEATRLLDATASEVAGLNKYAIEILGFTDSTGPQDVNLRLSQERANTVVRYLTTEHDMPLYRINVLGLGNVDPTADNKTADGRRKNRRVEVRIYVAGDEAGTARAGI